MTYFAQTKQAEIKEQRCFACYSTVQIVLPKSILYGTNFKIYLYFIQFQRTCTSNFRWHLSGFFTDVLIGMCQTVPLNTHTHTHHLLLYMTVIVYVIMLLGNGRIIYR